MNELQIFNNQKFGQVRTIEEGGKIYFVASDIAAALGYKVPHKAVYDHCKGVLKRNIPTNGGDQEMNVIPEGDIYRLAAKSELPGADEFESWIFDEVLPSIRKTGTYIAPTVDSKMLYQIAQALEEKEKQILLMKPKAEFFDAVADSKTAIEMSQVAKVLSFGKGRNTLFQVLREEGILRPNNEPYQEYIDRGYFRVIEQKFTKPTGETHISIKTLVYQKGLDYIRKIIDKRKSA